MGELVGKFQKSPFLFPMIYLDSLAFLIFFHPFFSPSSEYTRIRQENHYTFRCENPNTSHHRNQKPRKIPRSITYFPKPIWQAPEHAYHVSLITRSLFGPQNAIPIRWCNESGCSNVQILHLPLHRSQAFCEARHFIIHVCFDVIDTGQVGDGVLGLGEYVGEVDDSVFGLGELVGEVDDIVFGLDGFVGE